MKNLLFILIAVAAIVGLSSFYVVDQTEQALVLQFGEPVRVVNPVGGDEPGLHFKKPMHDGKFYPMFFLQDVVKLDKRIIELNAQPKELISADEDKSRVIIDAFVKYRIVDPLKFYQRARTENNLVKSFGPILESRLREVVGNTSLDKLLSEERTAIMQQVRDKINVQVQEVKGFGIEVVDVRIMRVDLPQENSMAVYNRMRTEREKEAKEHRAQGSKEGQIVVSEADKKKTIILAEAKMRSQIVRGEGEGEATRIFAESFGKDLDFFTFYRTMKAYRESIDEKDTTLVLSPDSDFLRYFNNVEGNKN